MVEVDNVESAVDWRQVIRGWLEFENPDLGRLKREFTVYISDGFFIYWVTVLLLHLSDNLVLFEQDFRLVSLIAL